VCATDEGTYLISISADTHVDVGGPAYFDWLFNLPEIMFLAHSRIPCPNFLVLQAKEQFADRSVSARHPAPA
jgi:hypothetical protein